MYQQLNSGAGLLAINLHYTNNPRTGIGKPDSRSFLPTPQVGNENSVHTANYTGNRPSYFRASYHRASSTRLLTPILS